jgi:hypothetical protein
MPMFNSSYPQPQMTNYAPQSYGMGMQGQMAPQMPMQSPMAPPMAPQGPMPQQAPQLPQIPKPGQLPVRGGMSTNSTGGPSQGANGDLRAGSSTGSASRWTAGPTCSGSTTPPCPLPPLIHWLPCSPHPSKTPGSCRNCRPLHKPLRRTCTRHTSVRRYRLPRDPSTASQDSLPRWDALLGQPRMAVGPTRE